MAVTIGDVKQAVVDYMHEQFSDPLLNMFVDSARVRINRDLRVREQIVRTSFTPAGNPEPLPADFLELREVFFSDGAQRVSVQLVSRKELARYANPNSSNRTRFASIDGKEIEFMPPGTGREFTIIYYVGQPQVQSDTDTGLTLDNYFPIWISAALIEAANYTQDDALEEKHLQKYTSEVEQANSQAADAESGAALMMTGSSSWHGAYR